MNSGSTSSELAQHLETAKRILNRIHPWWPIAEQVRGGVGTIPPVATLILPDTVWDDLTKEKQISLTFYAESMVGDVRDKPEKYLTNPFSAPGYSSMLANYRCIRDGFWEVIVGRFIDGDPKKLMVDRSVVRGDAFWNYEQDKFGVQASSFRQAVEKPKFKNLIPNAENAVIDIRKLRDYCLNPEHSDGKNKARLFSSILGMTATNAEELRQILLEVIQTHEAQLGRRDEFGQRYRLDFSIEWQNRRATLRSGWIIEPDSDLPRLTTCYPL
jgi:hypothetical protein